MLFKRCEPKKVRIYCVVFFTLYPLYQISFLNSQEVISTIFPKTSDQIVEVVFFGEPAEGIVVVFGEFFKEEALVSVMQKLKQ